MPPSPPPEPPALPSPPGNPPSPPSGTFYQFVFTKVRGPFESGTEMLQISEVKLFGGDGALVPVAATNPGGVSNAWQMAEKVMDGSEGKGSKWLDQNVRDVSVVPADAAATVVHSVLRLELAAPAQVHRYEIFTANDVERRDPVSWDFGIWREGEGFQVLSSVVDFAAPELRSTSYGSFYARTAQPAALSAVATVSALAAAVSALAAGAARAAAGAHTGRQVHVHVHRHSQRLDDR
jgi:hypothetical protein